MANRYHLVTERPQRSRKGVFQKIGEWAHALNTCPETNEVSERTLINMGVRVRISKKRRAERTATRDAYSSVPFLPFRVQYI